MKRRNFLWYSTLFMAGCAATNSRSQDSALVQFPSPFYFAVTDVSGLDELQQEYDDLRIAIAAALETEIEFFPVENYTAATVALKRGDIDLALAGPSEYIVINARTNAVPIIAVTRPNYYSIIAVSASSGIKTLAELKGKSIAMSDVGSTSGHLGPTKLLIDAGLDPATDIEIRLLGDEGSVAAIQQGEVDAWGGAATDYKEMLQDATNSFSIIMQGPPLPSDVFIASSSVDPALIGFIRERIITHQNQIVQAISLHHSKYVGSELVTANDEDYDPIRDVYQAIGQGEFI